MIDYIVVDNDLIKLKFSSTPQVSSLTNDKFSLFTNATEVQTPFKEIIVNEHYKSVARVLYLYFAQTLQPSLVYRFHIEGVRDVMGRSMGSYDHSFVLGTPPESATPGDIGTVIDDESPEFTPPPENAPVEVQDKSIIRRAFVKSETLIGASGDLYVVSSDPENNSVFVADDFERGRITVTFSQRPNTRYLNQRYIKVQRKKLGGVNRWEQLPIQVSLDSHYPTVYIYVPSLDATPAYNTDGASYFEDGYKYRVKLSREIGI